MIKKPMAVMLMLAAFCGTTFARVGENCYVEFNRIKAEGGVEVANTVSHQSDGRLLKRRVFTWKGTYIQILVGHSDVIIGEAIYINRFEMAKKIFDSYKATYAPGQPWKEYSDTDPASQFVGHRVWINGDYAIGIMNIPNDGGNFPSGDYVWATYSRGISLGPARNKKDDDEDWD